MFLQGCAGLIPGKEAATIRRGEGSFHVRKGRPGIVIGAPHGSTDKDTDIIAGDLAGLTGFSLVVMKGSAHPDAGRRFNVDRPTDSVPGTPARLEGETEEASLVYEAYRRHLAEAAQGPLRLYVEVLGNGHHGAGRLEIATVGLSRDDAWRLKTLFELIRDSRLDDPAVPRLEVRVESLDSLRSTAWVARPAGTLAAAPRALRIELPWAARTTYRETYTRILGTFLSESATFLVARER